MVSRFTKLFVLVVVLTQLRLLAPITAFADPITTFPPIVFDDNGTVTGYFQLDANGNLAAYSFTSSAWAAAGLSAFTYDSTDSTGTFSLIQPGATASGPPVAVLNIFAPDFTGRPRRNLELSFYETGPLTIGSSFGLCDISAGACLTDGPLSIPVQSGEQFLDSSNNEVIRDVNTGSLTLADPAGGISFSLNPSQTGSPSPMPEPSSLVLLGFGIAGFAFCRRKGLVRV